jgi:hypothetical protein
MIIRKLLTLSHFFCSLCSTFRSSTMKTSSFPLLVQALLISSTSAQAIASACNDPCVFTFAPLPSDVPVAFKESTSADLDGGSTVFPATTIILTKDTQPSPISVSNGDPSGTPNIVFPTATFGPFSVTGTKKAAPTVVPRFARAVAKLWPRAEPDAPVVAEVDVVLQQPREPRCPAAQAATPGKLDPRVLSTVLCTDEQIRLIGDALYFVSTMWGSDFVKNLAETDTIYQTYFPPGYGPHFQRVAAAIARNANIEEGDRQPLKFVCVNDPETVNSDTSGFVPSLQVLFSSTNYCNALNQGDGGSENGAPEGDGSDEGSDDNAGSIAITIDHSRVRYPGFVYTDEDLKECAEVIYLCPEFFTETNIESPEIEDPQKPPIPLYFQNPSSQCENLKNRKCGVCSQSSALLTPLRSPTRVAHGSRNGKASQPRADARQCHRARRRTSGRDQ